MANMTVVQALAIGGGPPIGTRIVDTARDVAENIDALRVLVTAGQIAGIDLSNGGRPSMAVTPAQFAANGSVLALITTPFTLQQSVTGAQVAGAALSPGFHSFTVWDSAANIAANLPAIQARYRDGTLGLVRFNETTVPNFSLSAAQVASNIDALRAIGAPFTISLSDFGTPTVTLPVWATSTSTYSTVLTSITTPYTLAIAGPMRGGAVASIVAGIDRYTYGNISLPANALSPLGGASTATLPGGLQVLDFQARLSGYIETLQLAAVAGKIASITTRDGGTQVLSLTGQQLTDSAAAMALFSHNIHLSQVIRASQAAAPILDSRFANFTVEDSFANIMANIPAIDALMRAGRLGRLRFTENSPDLSMTAAQLGQAALVLSLATESTLVITLTDGGTPSVTIAPEVLSVGAVRSVVLNQVVGSYNLSLSGGISANRAGVIVSENNTVLASLQTFRIADYASQLSANLAALKTLVDSGKLVGIDLLNNAIPALGLSGGNITTYTGVLALISNPFISGSAPVALASPMLAATLQANIATLRAGVLAGTQGSITLTDLSAPTLTMTAAALALNLPVLGKISNAFSISLSDIGTPAIALANWQATAANLAVLSKITSPGGYSFTVSDPVGIFTAAAIGNFSGNIVTNNVTVVGFASEIQASLGGLGKLAANGRLGSIRLLDSGPARVQLSGAEIAANPAVLAAITSPLVLAQIVTAAGAVGTSLSGMVDALAVVDTTPNILANLAALQTASVNGKIATIGGLTGAISLSAAQVAANAQALLKAGTGYSIVLTDVGTPTVTLQNWQVGSDIATLLNRITSPYALAINGAIRPNRAATLVDAGVGVYGKLVAGSLTVRESPNTMRNFLPQLTTLAKDGKLATVDTRGARPEFSLTTTENSDSSSFLSLINTPFTFSNIITVAEIPSAMLSGKFTSFTVRDSVANVLANLPAIQALAAARTLGRLLFTDTAPRLSLSAASLAAAADVFAVQDNDNYPIVLTDGGTPTVTVPAYVLGDFDFRNTTLDAIIGPWSLAVTGLMTAQTASAIIAEKNGVLAHLTGTLKIASYSWDLQPALDALELLGRAGKLATIEILDPALATISVSDTQRTANTTALGAIDTPFTLKTTAGDTIWAKKDTLQERDLIAFSPSQTLNLRDLSYQPAGTSFNLVGNALEILRDATTMASGTVTPPGGITYDSKSFYMAPDGSGGTLIKTSVAPISVTNTTTSSSFVTGGDFYNGAVTYLQRQFINPTGGSINAAANIPSVFLHGGGLMGLNALQALSGQNVLDGGTGSNFLTGGSGDDTFFLDGRGGGVSWGTVVNFNKGDAVTFWGWKDGVTNFDWFANAGAGGIYSGATIHARLGGGTGAYDASITFAGVDLATAQKFAFVTDTLGGTNTYAYIASL